MPAAAERTEPEPAPEASSAPPAPSTTAAEPTTTAVPDQTRVDRSAVMLDRFAPVGVAAAPAAGSYPMAPAIGPLQITSAAAPSYRTEVKRELGWAGFGLRLGSTTFRVNSGLLRAEAGIVDAAADTFGQVGSQALGVQPPAPVVTDRSGIRDFNSTVATLTPSLHLGGDGYFFKMEGILGLGSDFKTFGGGIYPINYGLFVKQVGLFPYFSLGLAGHYLTGKTRDMESKGLIGQARAAVGLKWCAFGWITVSAELGSSAVAAGIKDTGTGQESTMGNSKLDGVGGFGKSMDFSFGVELL